MEIQGYVKQRNGLARTPSHVTVAGFTNMSVHRRMLLVCYYIVLGSTPLKITKQNIPQVNIYCSLNNSFWYILVQIFNLDLFVM